MSTAPVRITSIKFEKATHVYSGQDEVCRCGCKGSYFPKGTVGFTRAVNRARKMIAEYVPTPNDVGSNYINISFGNDRAICVYFD